MHVGIVSFYDLDYGLDLANALNEAQVSVSLYLSQSHAIKAMNDSGQPAQRLYDRGLLDADVMVRLFKLPRMRELHSFAEMRRIGQAMRDDGVDIVHVLMGGGEVWTAILACLLHDIPVVSTMIIPQPNIGEYPPAPMVWAVNRLLAYGSDGIIVNGRDHVPLVQKLYGVPAGQVHYVPLGPRTIFRRWSGSAVPEEPGTILFFGRINQHKGLEYLVRAQPIITRQVPHARIVIAGQGNDLERCRGMMQDSSRFQVHSGFVPGDMAAELFQRASVVAVPYISAATSAVLMTAYVFSKPVVVTRVGSLPEYVQDGVTGVLVPPADVEQLAGAIVRLLSDDALRHLMGQNASRWVSGELSWQNIVVQTRKAYEESIATHRNA